MIKGQKVKLNVQVSDFKTEERDGVIESVIKNQNKKLFVIRVGKDEVCYRWENELKKANRCS